LAQEHLRTLLGGNHNSLNDLDFFNEESSGDSVLQAITAKVTTIRSGDASLVLSNESVSGGSKSGDTGEVLLADGGYLTIVQGLKYNKYD